MKSFIAALRSLVLPYGATSGSRIVLDGVNGRVFVYNSANELLASIAPTDGTDPDGTIYYQGIVDYAGQDYVQMGFGNIIFGVRPDPLDPSFLPQPGLLGIIGDSSGIFMQSATNQDLPDYCFIQPTGGKRSLGTSDPLYPHHDTLGDLWISDTVLKTVVPTGQSKSIPAKWQIPVLGAGWATGSTNGSYQPIQYRFDAEDNIHIVGVFHATSAAPAATVFTLPAASGSIPTYRPKIAQRLDVASYTSANTPVSGVQMIVNGTGTIQTVNTSAIVTNQNYAVNAKFPLGNLQ